MKKTKKSIVSGLFKYYHFGMLSFTMFCMLSCSEDINYCNKDLDIINEKINGVWVDKENIEDTILIFSRIDMNKSELNGALSYDFKLTENGFRTSMNSYTIRIIKTDTNSLFNLYSHNVFEIPRTYVIEFIDDKRLNLTEYIDSRIPKQYIHYHAQRELKNKKFEKVQRLDFASQVYK